MNKQEEQAFSYFFQQYNRLKDLNQPYRDNFDKYDEYYRGYRDATKYPMAYNYSFNKVIPLVQTVLSRVMAHLYRNDDVVIVKPKRSADVARSDIVQGVLNHQLNNLNDVDYQGGSYMVMLQWFLSALIHGKGIVKAFWRKEEQVGPRRVTVPVPMMQQAPNGEMFIAGMDMRDFIVETPQVIYDGPYVENIPIRNFLPDPEYRSIQKMPCVAHLYTKSLDWIKDQARKGVFKNIKSIGNKKSEMEKLKAGGRVDTEEFMQTFIDIEGAYTIEEIENERHKANNIDMIDIYGKYALEKDIYDVNGKFTLKGKEDEVVCTIGNYDTILRLGKCEYGIRPFFDVGCHINPSRYWDIGMVELIKDLQEAYNNIANLRLQNASMKINTMVKVLMDSEIDPMALTWKPFGIIPVESMDEVDIFDTPDVNIQTFRDQIEFFDNVIQDVTGIYDYVKGVTPERQEHVGTMYQIQSVGEARIKLLLLTMNYMGIKPLLKYLMVLNTYNLPSGSEFRLSGKHGQDRFARVFGSDLHVDFDFEAKYAALEPALAKESRIQQLMQYSQMWMQDPTVNQYEFKKAILELTDMMPAERYLRDPREVAQMQAQQAMQAMMPEMMKMETQKSIQDSKNQTELIKAALS